MKIAVLSNINMNGCIRILKRDTEIYEAEGYGNELGTLMNPTSSIHSFGPDMIVLVEDLCELIGHDPDEAQAVRAIEDWYAQLSSCIDPKSIYYISDAYMYGPELDVLVDKGLRRRIEYRWSQCLDALMAEKSNVRIFPYRELVEQLGTPNAFSMKMWYMGKILHSTAMLQAMAAEIKECIRRETQVPAKVLLLDLDNTLWGGLAGEDDITPIELSEDHGGLAYKNLQRVILQIQRQGVVLAIVSKNNEADALKIINDHPHMVLRSNAFAAKRINWDNKADNIRSIAAELNVGLDSMVFWDDNPQERQIVKELIPQVIVPDFPDRPEDLAGCMVEIWNRYFIRAVVTAEDRDKTIQYATNAERESLRETAVSFEDYLEGLKIVLTRKRAREHGERVLQLLNKTNQFNLTTQRHEASDIEKILEDPGRKIMVYQVEDRFGDTGIIAVAILRLEASKAVIEEFVMSCRVMGKNIENAIVEDLEQYAVSCGVASLTGYYRETPKNQPVKELYSRLGYSRVGETDGIVEYCLDLHETIGRDYRLTKIVEE